MRIWFLIAAISALATGGLLILLETHGDTRPLAIETSEPTASARDVGLHASAPMDAGVEPAPMDAGVKPAPTLRGHAPQASHRAPARPAPREQVTLALEVQGAGGIPLPELRLSLQATTGRAFEWCEGTTDAKGRITFTGLPVARLSIAVRDIQRLELTRRELRQARGSAARVRILRLPHFYAATIGYVDAQTGQAVRAATGARASDGERWRGWIDMGRGGTSRWGPRAPVPKAYFPQRVPTEEVTRDPAGTGMCVHIPLLREATIQICPVDQDAQPVAPVRVRAVHVGGRRMRVTTQCDAFGVVHVYGVPFARGDEIFAEVDAEAGALRGIARALLGSDGRDGTVLRPVMRRR